jgi:hypothetical protein
VNNSLSFLANVSIAKTIRLGYIFDWQLGELRRYSSSSHEIFLGFDFSKGKKQIVNPRYL